MAETKQSSSPGATPRVATTAIGPRRPQSGSHERVTRSAGPSATDSRYSSSSTSSAGEGSAGAHPRRREAGDPVALRERPEGARAGVAEPARVAHLGRAAERGPPRAGPPRTRGQPASPDHAERRRAAPRGRNLAGTPGADPRHDP